MANPLLRKPAVVGNWKMNLGPKGTSAFISELALLWNKLPGSALPSSVYAAVCTPFVSLSTALTARTQTPGLEIGAQNVHWEKSGAFTGETSVPLLQELGVQMALVGHSERRQFFGETHLSVQKRLEGALQQGLNVILCIGESRTEREAGQTETVLAIQLESALRIDGPAATALGRVQTPALWIAYEPVWAIGTGLTATPQQAQDAHAFIRSWIEARFGAKTAERTTLLYGGSVTPQNFEELLLCKDVDGGLVGGASLKPQSFMDLVNIAIGACAPGKR